MLCSHLQFARTCSSLHAAALTSCTVRTICPHILQNACPPLHYLCQRACDEITSEWRWPPGSKRAKHSFSSWACDDESITITYAWSREARFTHIFKLIDEESQMFELETKHGYWIPNPWHTHRSILILNGGDVCCGTSVE